MKGFIPPPALGRVEGVTTLPLFCLLPIVYQEVDIVKPVHQAMLLIAVDVEMIAASCLLVSDGLTGQIDLHFRLRVAPNAVEEFGQERLAHLYGEHKVVEFVVPVDIGKETADDHTEAIAGNGPCGMFTAGTATEVLASHQYTTAIGRVVEHKIFNYAAVLAVTPVTEQVVTKALLVCGLKKTGRDNLIGIYILQWEGNASGGDDIEFLFHNSSLGSVITPVTAAAAATNGEARMVRAPGP